MTNTPITEADYHAIRRELLASPQFILSREETYMTFFHDVVESAISHILRDFSHAAALFPFWKNYSPAQRGRAPIGTSVPWSEVGETAIGANILRAVVLKNSRVAFPGLPSGADLRFVIDNVFIHIDVKVTGPNDRPDEIVVSPNQLSRDGLNWLDGVVNSPVLVAGNRSQMIFQPELPPFYVIEGKVLLCLTYFLKGVYEVISYGHQPLSKLELLCVPNGLLAFDGPRYSDYAGLFIPGKDEKDHPKKRTRIRMGPLSQLAPWRRVGIWERIVPID